MPLHLLSKRSGGERDKRGSGGEEKRREKRVERSGVDRRSGIERVKEEASRRTPVWNLDPRSTVQVTIHGNYWHIQKSDLVGDDDEERKKNEIYL